MATAKTAPKQVPNQDKEPNPQVDVDVDDAQIEEPKDDAFRKGLKKPDGKSD